MFLPFRYLLDVSINAIEIRIFILGLLLVKDVWMKIRSNPKQNKPVVFLYVLLLLTSFSVSKNANIIICIMIYFVIQNDA